MPQPHPGPTVTRGTAQLATCGHRGCHAGHEPPTVGLPAGWHPSLGMSHPQWGHRPARTLPHAAPAISGSWGQPPLWQHCPCPFLCVHPRAHARPAALFLSSPPCLWPHLNLLVAGREATLLEERRVLPAPLQQPRHHLVVLLPAQLQLLGRGTRVGLGVTLWGAAAVVTPSTPTHVGLDTILHLGHARHGIVQRGHVGDDGLLIWLCHIHVCGEGGGQAGDSMLGRDGALQRDPPVHPSPYLRGPAAASPPDPARPQ